MKKLITYVVLICMIFTNAYAQYSDTAAHWASSEITKWSNVGILNGSDNLFRPDDFITRSEMAAVMNRILKYTTILDTAYNDVSGDMWFYNDVLKISTVMTGDGVNFRPYDNMTREEAVTLICKALRIDKQTIFINYDPSKISDWAKGYVSAAEEKNCLPKSFDDNNFQKSVTRAEVVYILDKLIEVIFFEDGYYNIDTDKSVVLSNEKSVISNMTIGGNLIVSESIAGKSITISNVDVGGKIYICGIKNGNVKLDNVVADSIVFEAKGSKEDNTVVVNPVIPVTPEMPVVPVIPVVPAVPETPIVLPVEPEPELEIKYYNNLVDEVFNKSGLENLSGTKTPYGQGVRMDAYNRPIDATNLQNKYMNYDAYFIAQPSDRIYLTFDEGYENGYTSKILDTLKEKDCTAVFFVTMDYVTKNPDLVRRMIDEGHVIGNHSANHKSMPTLSVDECVNEIVELHKYVRDNFGYEMYLFRPPMGEYSERTLEITKRLGYMTFLWSFAYRDWETDNQPNKTDAYKKITNAAHGGGIFLLHAVSKTNAEIVGDVIDSFRHQGYTVKAFEIGDN